MFPGTTEFAVITSRLGAGTLIAVAVLGLTQAAAGAAERSCADAEGSIHVPAFDLPPSSLLDAHARDASARFEELGEKAASACSQAGEGIAERRRCREQHFYLPLVAKLRARYSVRIQPETLDGIHAEIITPAEGVPPENRERVLINLHGGGFKMGGRASGQIESIPIAALAKMRVVSVDYRMAPEYTFPAASEDVAKVYRKLLDVYEAKNIGIYGCSAGGLLTAQAIAWLQFKGLPLPGAAGMFCAAANYYWEGDSAHFGAAHIGVPIDRLAEHPYFKGTNPADPLAFPARSDRMLAKFPPSLLITAGRDFAQSSVIDTHARLVAQGVDADLHVWEGVGHAFLYDPDLPQSREAYAVVARFFNRHLGGR